MVEYIKGETTELSPANAIIDCSGLGYAVNISLNTYATIQGKKECKLYIYKAIREDTYVLYESIGRQEHKLSLLLISVSGIGGNTARMTLLALPSSELINAIDTGNANLLKTVKGAGPKTTQYVIVGSKDRIKPDEIAAGTTGISAFTTANAQMQEEVIIVLTMLGFAQAPSQKVVMAILKEGTGVPVEQVIELVLKGL